jgi:2,4-dienoyl-CoA reductase-like NADH-dependent reductase (Old Yellow Enzyme family)
MATVDLFASYDLGSLRIRNRFIRSATTSGFADEDGAVGPEIAGWYEALARGGVGLIVKGHLYVDPAGKAHAGMAGISDDAHLPGLARVTGAVHRHGGHIVAQLNHAGYEAEAGRRVGPSDFATTEWRARAMDGAEIAAAVRSFGAAARRCLDAGFDGVQVHAAHGYLVSQFLSRRSNRRTDEWGGSLANRMRLLREICAEIRGRIGPEPVVGVKLNCDDFSEDGFTVEEAAEVARELAGLGVDFVEVSGGGVGSEERLRSRARSSDPALAEASFAGHCARIREATASLPLALVNGHRTLAGMQAVVDRGIADLVSLSRPFIRQPDLVARLAAGEAEVSCTRCDGCYDLMGEEMLRCTLDD